MTLREAFAYGKEFLGRLEIPEAETDAWLLLENACGCTRNEYYLYGDRSLEKEQEETYRGFLGQRAQRIPVQHILGSQEFMGLRFFVTPEVLVPRQDTETLVEEALKVIKPGSHVLDMCTGSGCILLSILHYAEGCSGTGADLSPEALKIAEKNAEALHIGCTLVQSDLFEHIQGRYDVIVSNPPYIATDEIEALMPEVKDHDPRMALDGGADGLVFYREIIRQSADHLKPGGSLLFEIGCTQAEEVVSMMKEAGFCMTEVKKDLAGLDRVVKGTLQEDLNV